MGPHGGVRMARIGGRWKRLSRFADLRSAKLENLYNSIRSTLKIEKR